MDLAHSAFADPRNDFIDAEAGTGTEGQESLDYRARVVGKLFAGYFHRTAICADFGAFCHPAPSEPLVRNQIRTCVHAWEGTVQSWSLDAAGGSDDSSHRGH